MTVREKIEGFLKTVTGLTYGHNEIILFDPEYIQDEQVGYSVNLGGKTLVTGKRGDWKENWLAIGINELTEDPIIADMNRSGLTVLTGQREEGDWQVFGIADSLDNFAAIIKLIEEAAVNRTTPDELEANPMPEQERKDLLKKIAEQNPKAQMWYWENFLE